VLGAPVSARLSFAAVLAAAEDDALNGNDVVSVVASADELTGAVVVVGAELVDGGAVVVVGAELVDGGAVVVAVVIVDGGGAVVVAVVIVDGGGAVVVTGAEPVIGGADVVTGAEPLVGSGAASPRPGFAMRAIMISAKPAIVSRPAVRRVRGIDPRLSPWRSG
jgi:hypothetical protein